MRIMTKSMQLPSELIEAIAHPIRDDDQYRIAMQWVDRLWYAPEGSPEDGALDVLLMLVDAYEQQAYPIPPPDPIDAIHFRLEQMGLDAAALPKLTGLSARRITDILERRRPLTLAAIRRFAAALDLSADTLIGVAA